MAQPRTAPSPSQLPTNFDLRLQDEQPEVLSWLQEHCSGTTLSVLVELCARTFEAAYGVGQPVAMLKQSCLNRALDAKVTSIDPKDRWMVNFPIGESSAQRFAIGRMMSALLSCCQPATPLPM